MIDATEVETPFDLCNAHRCTFASFKFIIFTTSMISLDKGSVSFILCRRTDKQLMTETSGRLRGSLTLPFQF